MKKIIPTLTLCFGLLMLGGCTFTDEPLEDENQSEEGDSPISVETRGGQAQTNAYQGSQAQTDAYQNGQAQTNGYQAGQDGAYPSGIDAERDFQGKPWENPSNSLSERVVYFNYDSSTVASEYRGLVQNHARYLASHPAMTVLLEGHADERGSREYNIALGEQRALAVRQMMMIQGVPGEQVQSISFGEEKPIAYGHDEVSYDKNRRVELVYVQY